MKCLVDGEAYSCTAFRAALGAAGFRRSMSARSNPNDNAWTESLIGTLKREMLQNGSFDTAQDAQTEIFEYVEGYYNTTRRHSSLGYRSPAQFEAILSPTTESPLVQFSDLN